MTRPQTMRDLVPYLTAHPDVEIHRPEHTSRRTGAVILQMRDVCRFSKQAGGGLWFVEPGGEEHYLPIDCGMTAAETGVELDEAGFTLTKFGLPIRVTYL